MDITPLRESRDFRIVFSSGPITFLGSTITYVALLFQVAHMRGSFVAVGLIGLVDLIPLVILGLYGGALADSIDHRATLLANEIALGLLTTISFVNALVPSPQH